MLRRAALLLALLGLAAALPAPALAQSQLFRDYREDGVVNPCQYSPEQLREGLQGLPPDVEQYVPGFGDQLRRSCPTALAPALPLETVQGEAVPVGPGGAPAAPRQVIPRPPAPDTPEIKRLPGVAPAVTQGPNPDLPAWAAALVAAALFGGFALILAVRYGAVELGGFGRGVKASSVVLGERVADGFAGLRDRLRR